VAYKRADLAIRALSEIGRPLVVVGDGPQRERLEKMAGTNVRFAGPVTDDELRDFYARCRALIFPNEEDFGIVPDEAQATGAPVIAFAAGGALETVIDPQTGLFFDAQTPNSLIEAVRRFESLETTFDSATARTNAQQFTRAAFLRNMSNFLSHEMGRPV